MSERYDAQFNRWSDGATRPHCMRYFVAKGYIDKKDVVVDYGCGTGYGKEYLKKYCQSITGIDKFKGKADVNADLENLKAEYPSDVSICMEVLEHLKNPKVLVDRMKRDTKKYIVISFPNIESAGINEFHLHDLTTEQMNKWMIDDKWKAFGKLIQGTQDILIYYNSNYYEFS